MRQGEQFRWNSAQSAGLRTCRKRRLNGRTPLSSGALVAADSPLRVCSCVLGNSRSAFVRTFRPIRDRPQSVVKSLRCEPKLGATLRKCTRRRRSLRRYKTYSESWRIRTPTLGNESDFEPHRDYPLIDAASPDECKVLIAYLQEQDLVELTHTNITLTVDGWRKIEERGTGGGIRGRCFVAMWFTDELNDAYELGIGAAIKTDCCLPEPVRIDRQQFNEKICDRILAEIRKCQFMVADFTGQRGGVYFEAGFAMGLGRPVICTCRESDLRGLHFDTRQYSHIVWSTPKDLREKLRDRILATIPIDQGNSVIRANSESGRHA